MALRDLVMGGGGCAVPGTSSWANPLGGLAESLFGSASKTQERLQELTALPGHKEPSTSELGLVTSLPGSEYEQHPDSQISGFLRGFHGADHHTHESTWNEINAAQMPQQPYFQENASPSVSSEFAPIYNPEAAPITHLAERNPQQVLSGFLQSFLDSSRAEVPFQLVRLPELGLSDADKQRIRDRSSVMARHFFADKGDEYVNAQVNALLHSLDIESELRAWRPQGGRFSELLQEPWNEAAAGRLAAKQNGWHVNNLDQCAEEFNQEQVASKGPQHWAKEFLQQQGDGWADQFSEEQTQKSTWEFVSNQDAGNLAPLEQTRSLAYRLSQNQDPKFQHADRSYNWVYEYSRPGTSANEGWIDAFAKLNREESAHADELSRTAFSEDLNNKYVEQKVGADQSLSSSSERVYLFADQNPYVGHLNPLKEGQDLFRLGLLSEAVLALEAEVLKNPDNAEGWCLLGITHAENDNDRQAIASMVWARDVEPTNLEVLLSLGVSHTNELEQQEALKYLRGWLQHHPKYGRLIPVDQVPGLNHVEVMQVFHEAAQMSPEDPDVHTVLGVLYNLSREYDKAIEAFRTALQLKPRDYSLWNKLGATQANSARSIEALHAYQEALNLKPNYVRAWSNMGISYANQGRYEESVRFYVRALCMNPKAENTWQYLRISLCTAARGDLLDACDKQDLELLQQVYPL